MSAVQPRILSILEPAMELTAELTALDWIRPASAAPDDQEPIAEDLRITALIGEAAALLRQCTACGIAQGVLEDGDWNALVAARRSHPKLQLVPRWAVVKPKVSFAFSREAYGDGFKTYRADPATVKGGYRLADGSHKLEDQLARARDARLPAIWLHSPRAEERGKGLDLELLEFVSRRFYGSIWLSGGLREPRHLSNFAAEAGAHTLVAPARLVAELGVEVCRNALIRQPPPRLSRLLHSLRSEVTAS